MDGLRNVSTLPFIIEEKAARRITRLFQGISAAAVLFALVFLTLSPSAQTSVALVSPTLLEAPYSCTMLSRVSQTQVDVNISAPFFESGPPVSSLFVIRPASGTVTAAPATGPLDALFCTTLFPNTAYDSFSLKTSALYGTYEACLADVEAATACAAAADTSGMKYLANCNFGSQAIKLAFSFTPYFNNVTSGYAPSCNETITITDYRYIPGSGMYPLDATFFSPARVKNAITSVFSPAAICAPFAKNVNPPYLCTSAVRQSALSIILQSLSFYTTSMGILCTLLTTALPYLGSGKRDITTVGSAEECTVAHVNPIGDQGVAPP